MNLHLMIDIETLDTAPSALVLSCGWAWFDTNGVLASGQQAFDNVAQLRLGRTISAGTVRWWKSQVALLPPEVPGATIWQAFAGMLASRPRGREDDALVWANSPSFDLTILRHWAAQMRTEPFWRFASERDYRTWKHHAHMANDAACEAAKKKGEEPAQSDLWTYVDNENKHDAEADAVWQAKNMICNQRFCAF